MFHALEFLIPRSGSGAAGRLKRIWAVIMLAAQLTLGVTPVLAQQMHYQAKVNNPRASAPLSVRAGTSTDTACNDTDGPDYDSDDPTHTISGNAGAPGVTLSYKDGTAKTATADGTGAYSITVSPCFSGTVTPSLTGYTFSPTSRTYGKLVADATHQDYTATAIVSTFTISGNAGVGGATLTFTGGSTTADGSGMYSFSVPSGWTGTVTPSLTGYTFTPPSISYTDVTANEANQDFTATQVQPTCDVFCDLPVPGKEWMDPYIIRLYDLGILTPCSATPLLICPTQDITREEAAVLVLRALHGGSYQPPAASHFFADMPVAGKEWMEPWVDEYWREGLTTGCGANPLIYCPERNATRAEMAVFLLRGLHGSGWQPPAATGIFADVPVTGKEWMQPWIEAFYNDGISTGCGSNPLIYCPEAPTSRADFAVFLARGFHLYP